jgi:hypothetical protein
LALAARDRGRLRPILPLESDGQHAMMSDKQIRTTDLGPRIANMPTTELSAPHQTLEPQTPRERLAIELFDALWRRYRERVSYVRDYEAVVSQLGATFVNDHIAFRTIATQQPTVGIATLARVFEALGYQAAGCYAFPDKHLGAIHYQHPRAGFPKLFISELKTWEVDPAVRKILLRILKEHRPPLADSLLASLQGLDDGVGGRASNASHDKLLNQLVRFFHQLPWPPPAQKDVVAVNKESQYAAWVMVHGYNVNHFTALINSQGVPQLADIERTIDRLSAAGVPMKTEIEGARGSKLRQTATEAVMLDVAVRGRQKQGRMPWTYAYFELAERGEITDSETGRRGRFEGFLGPQATQLFEMTKIKG